MCDLTSIFAIFGSLEVLCHASGTLNFKRVKIYNSNLADKVYVFLFTIATTLYNPQKQKITNTLKQPILIMKFILECEA